jgi:hypothetical protein
MRQLIRRLLFSDWLDCTGFDCSSATHDGLSILQGPLGCDLGDTLIWMFGAALKQVG